MLKINHLITDLKQILRDPIMAIMLVAPLLLIIVFKAIITFVIPFVTLKLGFDFSPYSEYIFAFVLLISSGMLGIVTGFLMLDDRDGNIADLMMITPLGRGGYLINRLIVASSFSFYYSNVNFRDVLSPTFFNTQSFNFISHLQCNHWFTSLFSS